MIKTHLLMLLIDSLTQGSKLSTKYTWSFNDSTTPVNKSGLANSTVAHRFKKYGMYMVSVTATNKKGKSVKTLQFRVEGKIDLSHLGHPVVLWLNIKQQLAHIFRSHSFLSGHPTHTIQPRNVPVVSD